MRRALLVVNRKSRKGGSDLSAIVDRLERGGVAAALHECPPQAQMGELIAAEGRTADLVILGGGDGTLNAALEALAALGKPVGLLPLGTANDLARTLGIPADPMAAAEIIAGGSERRIDLGWVNGKHFLNAASIGLAVDASAELTREVKRRWGKLGYAVGAARALRRARPFTAQVRCDGKHMVLRAIQVGIGNGRHFGGGMVVAEDARIDDSRLDLFMIEPCGIWRFALLLPRLKWGRHGMLTEVHTCRGKEIDLDTDREMAISTDGEVTGRTPARFRVVPRAMAVLVPRRE